MPIYEYACRACNHEFEELLFNTKATVKCPKCESKKVKRLLSKTAIKTSEGFRSTASGGGCKCGSGGCGGGCGGCGSGGAKKRHAHAGGCGCGGH